MDDANAIVRLKGGDIGGLEPLVLKYQALAIRTAFGILRDSALAQDVVQSAFVRLPERIRRFDAARPFAPWFLRVVSHDAVDKARREAHSVPFDWSEADDSNWHLATMMQVSSPEALLERASSSAELWGLIGELSPEQRAVIVLRYYSGLTTAEVAEELSVPAGTVRWRLHAAHQRLRGLLKRLATGSMRPKEAD
jgi:RNA polymerase sigma-70 factor (ECF subfamily)